MDRSHLNQKHMKNANCLQVCSQKVFKVSTVCMDTCLETLSSLVICSVNNVLSEIGPYRNQFVKDSERTKNKMLAFCMVLIFALIFITFGRHLLDR